MTMDANELRALADALSVPHYDLATVDVIRAADYLRALVDAQPTPAVPHGWKWVPVEPTPEMLSAVGMMDGYDWHAPGCSPDADHATWYSAMIAAAPAAPQAEPKREPLSDERIDEIGEPFGYFQYGDAQGDKRRAFARAVERAAYERAVMECLETAAELRRCADGCTDGRYDWKADGALDCADAIRALGGNDGN
jgi:hypothetical protein